MHPLATRGKGTKIEPQIRTCNCCLAKSRNQDTKAFGFGHSEKKMPPLKQGSWETH